MMLFLVDRLCSDHDLDRVYRVTIDRLLVIHDPQIIT